MGVLGRVARDLPTGVGEGPPSVADSGGSRCPQSAPPGLTVKSCRPISGCRCRRPCCPRLDSALPARH